jgi:hypothetical protein
MLLCNVRGVVETERFIAVPEPTLEEFRFRFLIQIRNRILHKTLPLMLEAALFPRKLSCHFRFFGFFCVASGSGTESGMHSGFGSAEAKSCGFCGSGSTTLPLPRMEKNMFIFLPLITMHFKRNIRFFSSIQIKKFGLYRISFKADLGNCYCARGNMEDEEKDGCMFMTISHVPYSTRTYPKLSVGYST